jgi:hypothetical protein
VDRRVNLVAAEALIFRDLVKFQLEIANVGARLATLGRLFRGGSGTSFSPRRWLWAESTTCEAEFGRIQGERMGSSVDTADGAARALST